MRISDWSSDVCSSDLPFDEMAENGKLGGNLGAADDRGDRPLRIAEGSGKRFQLGLHVATGGGGQQSRDRLGRGMGAMGGREGVVDVDIAEPGERRREAIGRASCRERVWQYVSISWVAGSLKKN